MDQAESIIKLLVSLSKVFLVFHTQCACCNWKTLTFYLNRNKHFNRSRPTISHKIAHRYNFVIISKKLLTSGLIVMHLRKGITWMQRKTNKNKRDATAYAKISVRPAPTSFVLESASVSNLDAVFSISSFFSTFFLYCPTAARLFMKK